MNNLIGNFFVSLFFTIFIYINNLKLKTMNKNVFSLIRLWANNRGIYQSGNTPTQFTKLAEEQGELAKTILKRDDKEFYDAIGDCVVVLTNLVELYEKERRERTAGPIIAKNIEDCIELAYNVIASRKGNMINGTFVKDEN